MVYITQAQTRRLQAQTNTMLFWFDKRVRQLRLILKHFAAFPHHGMRDFYRAYPGETIESLVDATCAAANICRETFRKWRKQYILTGKFKRLGTGTDSFSWLLLNNDKKIELTHWMKCQKELSVHEVRDFINNVLLSDIPVGLVTECTRLHRPVCYATAHRWMLDCGATYDEAKKSYLTDSHEKHDTILYRIWFCDLDFFLSLRMHRWVCFPSPVVKKLKEHYQGDWPADRLGKKIPIKDVGRFPPGISCVKYIHVTAICVHSPTHSLTYVPTHSPRCWYCRLRGHSMD